MARNMARYTPRTDLLRSALPSFPDVGNLLRSLSLAPVLRDLETAPRMKVDIEETDQAYILRADVPGADREDIAVTIDGNTVSIRANIEQQRMDPSGNMLTVERVYGEEYRVFTLPQDVDESKAEARIENGVLVLTLPKKTGTSAKKLNIQSGRAAQEQPAGGAAQAQPAAGGTAQAQPAGGAAQAQPAGGATQAQPAGDTGKAKPS